MEISSLRDTFKTQNIEIYDQKIEPTMENVLSKPPKESSSQLQQTAIESVLESTRRDLTQAKSQVLEEKRIA